MRAGAYHYAGNCEGEGNSALRESSYLIGGLAPETESGEY